MRWRWWLILVLIGAAGVDLVGNASAPLFDRDEPRYAQCSRQMLQSGDWVVPRLYDRIRAAKPPGIYWLQASVMSALGDNAFSARLPSSLAGVCTALLLGVLLWKAVGPQRAVWAVFIFVSSALTIFTSKVCLTDAVQLLWIVVALACVYLLWRRRGGWPAVIGLSISIGLAGLTKGPFVLGVLGGTVLILGFLRLWDWNRSVPSPEHDRPAADALTIVLYVLVGIVLVSAIVGPWLLLVYHRQSNFLSASTHDAMEHLETGSEGHVAPPGYHLALIWFTFLPWSLFLPMAIVTGWRNRATPVVRFALASVLGTWVFVEVMQTKLPHYILPAFPGLAVLTADALVRCFEEPGEFGNFPFRVATFCWAMIVIALATVPWWWLNLKFHTGPWAAAIAMSACGLLYAAVVCAAAMERLPRLMVVAMGVGSVAFAAMLFGAYLPHSPPLHLSQEAAGVLVSHGVTHPGESLMLDYKEPSLAFYQGGTIREAKHSLPVLQHPQTAPPWLVVTGRMWDSVGADVRSQFIVVARFRGLDYSDSLKPYTLLVVRRPTGSVDSSDR